jgi:hypothetical protein
MQRTHGTRTRGVGRARRLGLVLLALLAIGGATAPAVSANGTGGPWPQAKFINYMR